MNHRRGMRGMRGRLVQTVQAEGEFAFQVVKKPICRLQCGTVGHEMCLKQTGSTRSGMRFCFGGWFDSR